MKADHAEGWQECANDYRSFLLRCWQEGEPETENEPGFKATSEASWRFTLARIDDEQSKKGFASLEALVDYLQAELQESET